MQEVYFINMKAGFALLASRTVENAVNRLAWDIHTRWGTGVSARCYPAHISLKQPFELGNRLPEFEAYMAAFTASTPPLEIEVGRLLLWDTVLVFDVRETPTLRSLHNRLNRDLPPIFGAVRAEHDGDEYHFHMTVASGGASADTYRAILAAQDDVTPPPPFTAYELGLFTGYARPTGGWQFMLHTVLPLTGEPTGRNGNIPAPRP
jgi:2'-5' RNA ligase